MPPLSIAYKIVRDLGPDWVLGRLKFALDQRLGFLSRRLPAQSWNGRQHRAGSGSYRIPRFFFNAETLPRLCADRNVVDQADRVLGGEWPYFSHSWMKAGFPPDWHLNPYTRRRAPADLHWSNIDIDALGDVKLIWEASRFSPAYLLARACARTCDQRYAEGFWRLVEDWAVCNPPNTGVNWGCGQETSFRVMAWCFALFAFAESPTSTPDRTERLVGMMAVHAKRIAGHIEYALSQRNNHGISEAAGLFTIGVLFPQLPQAEQWRDLGERLIVGQLRDQIYPDGSYIQNSFNYQRVMMDVTVWALRLGEVNDCRFPDECYEYLGKSVAFMLRLCDPQTGRMPNYGGNDGALVLPLTSCDYQDYRPTLQAAHFLVHRSFCFSSGAWDEIADWLFAAELHNPKSTNPRNRNIFSNSTVATDKSSGYLKLSTRDGYAMLRAAKYRDRPAQADQLHLDLWWRGENIACDAGSYLYGGVPPWDNGLARTAVHNTVTVGGRDQMTRAGRFLWLDWMQARVAFRSEYGLKIAAASHDGYKRIGCTHVRSVLWSEEEDFWIVLDDITGKGSEPCRLHWLFPDCQYEFHDSSLSLTTAIGILNVNWSSSNDSRLSLARAGNVIFGTGTCDETRGWRSLYYAEKIPALSLALESEAPLPIRFVTVFAPEGMTASIGQREIQINSRSKEYRIAIDKLSFRTDK